jgi:hypothetical protein
LSDIGGLSLPEPLPEGSPKGPEHMTIRRMGLKITEKSG